MNPIEFNLAGLSGLTYKFQGDLNSTSSTPNLRYTDFGGSFAEGIFNPLRKLGYMLPANNTFSSITESLNSYVIATEYDSINDIAYFAENGNTVWKLDGLDDTSLASVIVADAGGTETLTDIKIYEINGKRALYYAYKMASDSNDYGRVGVYSLDSDSGSYVVKSLDEDNEIIIESIIASGTYQKLAQSYKPDSDNPITFSRVVLPISRSLTDDGGYTFKVSIQDSTNQYSVRLREDPNTVAVDGSYLSITDASQTGLDITGDISFEFWIKFEDLPSTIGKDTILIQKWLESGNQRSYKMTVTPEDSIFFTYDSGGGGTNVTEWLYTGFFTSADVGEWVHVAYTHDVSAGRSGGVIYKNGIKLTTPSQTGANAATSIFNSSAAFEIGGSGTLGASEATLNAQLDDVRVWSDIRTEAEVFDNYRFELTGSEGNLVAYWRFENNLLDTTANNNDLTNNNTAIFKEEIPDSLPGVPDGSVDASATTSASNLKQVVSGGGEKESYIYLDLDTQLTKNKNFFVVVEPTVFGDMGGTDEFSWYGSVSNPVTGGIALRHNGTSWGVIAEEIEDVDDPDIFDFNFALVEPNSSNWLGEVVAGSYKPKYNADMFFVKSDNGFMYMFENNMVHKIDGTLTGGGTGSFTQSVLRFPSYFQCVDAVDTRGRMYIGVQSNPESGVSDTRTYSESVVGIYVWDRQSNVFGARDFIPLYGVRDIKKVYVDPNGDVRVLCIGDDRFVQIRSLASGRNGEIIHQLGLSAYPNTRYSLKNMNGLTVWLGADGIFYMHGKPVPGQGEQLYKIGDISAEVTGAFTTGAIFIGNEEASQSLQKVLFSFSDTNSTDLKGWYPHGVGTINSVAQKGHIGNTYTLVKFLPRMTHVDSIDLYMLPTSSTGSTVIGTVKIYFNQSSTAWASKSITLDQASKGQITIPINKPYVHSVQLEFEYSTTQTLGDDDFAPIAAYVNPKQTGGVNRA